MVRARKKKQYTGYLTLGQFLTCPGEVKVIKPLTILMKKKDEITPCDIGV